MTGQIVKTRREGGILEVTLDNGASWTDAASLIEAGVDIVLNRALARIEAGFIMAGADFVPAEQALRPTRARSPLELGLDQVGPLFHAGQSHAVTYFGTGVFEPCAFVLDRES